MIGTRSSSISGLSKTQVFELVSRARRDLFELHNQILDHAELNTGIAQKTIRIVTNPEDRRPPCRVLGEDLGMLRADTGKSRM